MLKWSGARLIAIPALIMPYRIRTRYIRALSFCFHLPFRLFGLVAKYLLEKLEIDPVSEDIPEESTTPWQNGLARESWSKRTSSEDVVVIFSGGSDSTCVAALMAHEFKRVHLLTYCEHATRNSPGPKRNLEALRKRFPDTEFIHSMQPIDGLVRHFSYFDYYRSIRKFGLLTLSTCGFSTLSWHVRTILYCKRHRIDLVADGLTRELMHFPGHMDEVVALHRQLYQTYNIQYVNPVREWPVPKDQQFIDRVLVNRHESDFFLGDQTTAQRKTTGKYLFDLGILPSVNVKGSRLDFQMQQDCYPFALYNVIAFWGFLSIEPYEIFCRRISTIQFNRIAEARRLIDDFRSKPNTSRLASLLELS